MTSEIKESETWDEIWDEEALEAKYRTKIPEPDYFSIKYPDVKDFFLKKDGSIPTSKDIEDYEHAKLKYKEDMEKIKEQKKKYREDKFKLLDQFEQDLKDYFKIEHEEVHKKIMEMAYRLDRRNEIMLIDTVESYRDLAAVVHLAVSLATNITESKKVSTSSSTILEDFKNELRPILEKYKATIEFDNDPEYSKYYGSMIVTFGDSDAYKLCNDGEIGVSDL